MERPQVDVRQLAVDIDGAEDRIDGEYVRAARVLATVAGLLQPVDDLRVVTRVGILGRQGRDDVTPGRPVRHLDRVVSERGVLEHGWIVVDVSHEYDDADSARQRWSAWIRGG